MKKRIMSGLALFLVCAFVFSVGTSSSFALAKAAPAKTAPKVVYLVNGSLGDKGFFDSAASGLDLMKKGLGSQVKAVEMGRDETTYESNFMDVSDQDWDIIVSGTWSVKELVEKTSVQYPKKKYIVFDCNIDRKVANKNNVMGINYKSNQGAYLAGVLAARMLDSGNPKINAKKRTLGFIGSMDVAGINDFLVGYLQGVASVDPKIKVLTSYVGSFEDVSKCLEMTTQLYNQGAQIVYAPASQSIIGAATAASNVDKYLIACDQDLYKQLVKDQPKIAKNILTSTLKNVGQSLYTAVKAAQSNKMSYSQTYSLGLESGAIGLAENENFKKIVPKKIIDQLAIVKYKIIKGNTKVGSAFTMTTAQVAALRDKMK